MLLRVPLKDFIVEHINNGVDRANEVEVNYILPGCPFDVPSFTIISELKV